MENKNPDPGPPPLTASLPIPPHDASHASLRTRQGVSGSCDQQSRDEQADKRLDPTMNTALDSQQPNSGGCNNTSGALFAWQRLPQKALDQIAYNSRKQRNARLKASPPFCAYCPTKRFTSMAMLSTHWRSKSHLAQVRKQEGLQPPTKAHANSMEPQSHNLCTQQDVVMRNADGVEKDPIDALPARSLNATDSKVERAASPCSEYGTVVTDPVADLAQRTEQQTAKQRKRKEERDRKKTRARMNLLSKNAGRLEVEESSGEVPVDNGHLKDISTQQSGPLHGDTTGQHVEPVANNPENGGDTGSLATPSDARTEGERIALPQTTPHKRWNCTVCKTVWKRQKAWQGHLLSAQHMRHLLRAMHEIAPPIRATGKLEAMASMDPFGWGTGVGAVEEEEDEEEGEEQDRYMNEPGARGQVRINMLPKDGKNTHYSYGGEDDDDMDLGD